MLPIKHPVYIIICVVLLLCSVSSSFAADASERRFIRQGMDEGDVLVKIGKPDSESGDVIHGGPKRWIYFPKAGDERIVTTIYLEGGQVVQVTRVLVQ